MLSSKTAIGKTILLVALITATGHFAHAEIQDITWELGPNLPEYRKGGCGFALGDKVISAFGMRQPWGEMETVYVYDPETDWWLRGPNGPVGQCYVQGTEIGNGFISVGGRKGSVRTECYRIEQGENGYVWSQIASLNESRGWAPSVEIEGKIYVFGGAKGGHGPTVGSVEMLETTDSKAGWQVVSEIPGRSRGWLAAGAIDGKVYLAGGYHFPVKETPGGPPRERLDEVLCFDPESGQWEERSPLPFRLSGMDSCVYKDRYLIVVGGAPMTEDFSPEMKTIHEKTERYESYYSPFVLVYDAVTDRWKILAGLLPWPTNDIRVVLLGDRLYAMGGENVEPATSNTTAWFRIGTILE